MSLKKLSTLILVVFLGCAETPAPGELVFEWRLGSLGCEHYGVKRVQSALFSFQSSEPVMEAAFDCQALVGRLTNIEPGEYALELSGRDDEGCATHEARQDVAISSGANVVLERPLGLKRKQRPLEITWNFANRLDCLANDISQVEILVESDDEESFTEVRSCEGFTAVIEVDSPASQLSITVFGVNDTAERTHSGVLTLPRTYFLEAPCEPVLRALTVLDECSQTNCAR